MDGSGCVIPGESLEVTSFRLESVMRRVKQSVSALEILAWLEQFRSDDKESALRVLEAVEYYEDDGIVAAYSECLVKLEQEYGDAKYFALPIGQPGKSGSAMLYHFAKALTLHDHLDVKVLSNPKQLRGRCKSGDVLVLVDDFLGSGRSSLNYYRHEIVSEMARQKVILQSVFLCVVALDNAKAHILEEYPSVRVISAAEYRKAFSPSGSVFGYYNRMRDVREMCWRYGQGLFVTHEPGPGQVKEHPLGFENSQALVVFSYGPPNNTLPILWSSARRWVPLFPRQPRIRVSDARRCRAENAYWLSRAEVVATLYRSGRGHLEERDYTFVTKTDFELFTLIKLRNMHRSNAVICQILGISIVDLNDLVARGVERGVLDQSGELTELGKQSYIEVRQRMDELGRNPYTQLAAEGNCTPLHVPRTFRGKR